MRKHDGRLDAGTQILQKCLENRRNIRKTISRTFKYTPV